MHINICRKDACGLGKKSQDSTEHSFQKFHIIAIPGGAKNTGLKKHVWQQLQAQKCFRRTEHCKEGSSRNTIGLVYIFFLFKHKSKAS